MVFPSIPRSEAAVSEPLKAKNGKCARLPQSRSFQAPPSIHLVGLRSHSGGDPRFEILFPVWTNPLLCSVYSERSYCLGRSAESPDLRSSPSTGCHGHRRGCTCTGNPSSQTRGGAGKKVMCRSADATWNEPLSSFI